jgi:hypothetical protein
MVNLGTAIKVDRKKNRAYRAADITITAVSLAPNRILLILLSLFNRFAQGGEKTDKSLSIRITNVV